jgi:hypothetical protein
MGGRTGGGKGFGLPIDGLDSTFWATQTVSIWKIEVIWYYSSLKAVLSSTLTHSIVMFLISKPAQGPSVEISVICGKAQKGKYLPGMGEEGLPSINITETEVQLERRQFRALDRVMWDGGGAKEV